jgi:hypothetical protein
MVVARTSAWSEPLAARALVMALAPFLMVMVSLPTPAPRRIRNASMTRVLWVRMTSVSAFAPAARSIR